MRFGSVDVCVETINVLVSSEEDSRVTTMIVDAPPSSAKGICALTTMSEKRFLKELRKGKIAQICSIVADDVGDEDLRSSSTLDVDVLDDKTKVERFESQSSDSLKDNPVYDLLGYTRMYLPKMLCVPS